MQIRCVFIKWARENKLDLHDSSLCQKPVGSVGSVYALAVSDTLALHGSRTNRFFCNKKKKVNGGVRFTFWPIIGYSNMSAVGDD